MLCIIDGSLYVYFQLSMIYYDVFASVTKRIKYKVLDVIFPISTDSHLFVVVVILKHFRRSLSLPYLSLTTV